MGDKANGVAQLEALPRGKEGAGGVGRPGRAAVPRPYCRPRHKRKTRSWDLHKSSLFARFQKLGASERKFLVTGLFGASQHVHWLRGRLAGGPSPQNATPLLHLERLIAPFSELPQEIAN